MEFKIVKETKLDEDENKIESIYWTVPANPIRRLLAEWYNFISTGESKTITLHLSKEEAVKYIKNYNSDEIRRQYV